MQIDRPRHLITVLIPAFNEAAVLPELYDRLSKLAVQLGSYDFEFLFVDDGSSDATPLLIKKWATTDSRITFRILSRNFGKETAMLAGFDAANGDALVVIDADLQDPPELIPQLLAEWENGYEDVYAQRISRRGESWLKKETSKLYYRLLQSSTNIPIQIDTGDFRLLDHRCVVALREFREANRYTKGMFSWIGYKKKAVPYERDTRAAGNTKWSYRKLLNLAVNGLTSFTTAPLRLSTFLGMIVSCAAFIYLIVIVARTIFWGNHLAGYPSTLAVILFLGGVQLLSLGIIGEYIGRIFNETKRRPAYFLQQSHDAATRNHE